MDGVGAAAGADHVVAAEGEKDVVARVAHEDVVAVIGRDVLDRDQRVAPVRAGGQAADQVDVVGAVAGQAGAVAVIDGVDAAFAVEPVVAGIADQPVVARAAFQPVVADPAREQVVARVADQLVVPGVAGDGVVEAGADHVLDAGDGFVVAADEPAVGVHVDEELAVGLRVVERVAPVAAVERVDARVVQEDVVAVAAFVDVVAEAPVEHVVAAHALQEVVEIVAGQAVGEGAGAQVLDPGDEGEARAGVLGAAGEGDGHAGVGVEFQPVGAVAAIGDGAAAEGGEAQDVVIGPAIDEAAVDRGDEQVVAGVALQVVLAAGAAVEHVVGGVADQAVGLVGADQVLDGDQGVEALAGVLGAALQGEEDGDGPADGLEGHGVGAVAAVEAVIAEAGGQDVVAAAPVEQVVARAPVEPVGGVGARERVAEGGAGGVLEAAQGDAGGGEVARAQDRRALGRQVQHHAGAEVAQVDRVDAGAAVGIDQPAPDLHQVVPVARVRGCGRAGGQPAQDQVVVARAGEEVRLRVDHVQGIVALARVDDGAAGARHVGEDDAVVAAAGQDVDDAVGGRDRIVAAEAADHRVALPGVDDVGPVIAEDRVGEIGAGDVGKADIAPAIGPAAGEAGAAQVGQKALVGEREIDGVVVGMRGRVGVEGRVAAVEIVGEGGGREAVVEERADDALDPGEAVALRARELLQRDQVGRIAGQGGEVAGEIVGAVGMGAVRHLADHLGRDPRAGEIARLGGAGIGPDRAGGEAERVHRAGAVAVAAHGNGAGGGGIVERVGIGTAVIDVARKPPVLRAAAGQKRVVARAAEHGVHAVAAREHVVALAALQPVVAVAAGERVAERVADQDVVMAAADDVLDAVQRVGVERGSPDAQVVEAREPGVGEGREAQFQRARALGHGDGDAVDVVHPRAVAEVGVGGAEGRDGPGALGPGAGLGRVGGGGVVGEGDAEDHPVLHQDVEAVACDPAVDLVEVELDHEGAGIAAEVDGGGGHAGAGIGHVLGRQEAGEGLLVERGGGRGQVAGALREPEGAGLLEIVLEEQALVGHGLHRRGEIGDDAPGQLRPVSGEIAALLLPEDERCGVAARAAAQRVVARAAMEQVVAQAAFQRVVARVAEERVARARAGGHARAAIAQDQVVAGAARQQVGARVAAQHVAVLRADQVLEPLDGDGVARERLRAGQRQVEGQRVGRRVARGHVGQDQDVGARAAAQGGVAGEEFHPVVVAVGAAQGGHARVDQRGAAVARAVGQDAVVAEPAQDRERGGGVGRDGIVAPPAIHQHPGGVARALQGVVAVAGLDGGEGALDRVVARARQHRLEARDQGGAAVGRVEDRAGEGGVDGGEARLADQPADALDAGQVQRVGAGAALEPLLRGEGGGGDAQRVVARAAPDVLATEPLDEGVVAAGPVQEDLRGGVGEGGQEQVVLLRAGIGLDAVQAVHPADAAGGVEVADLARGHVHHQLPGGAQHRGLGLHRGGGGQCGAAGQGGGAQHHVV